MSLRWKLLTNEQQTMLSRHAVSAAEIDSRASRRAYDEYLLTEYNNIASAHFNADTNITRFFQFYLIIIALPITIFGIVLQFASGRGDGPSGEGLSGILSGEYAWFLGVALLAIAVVGVCMLAYIVNLRLDSLLYARVVNGIRRHFIARGDLDIEDELSTRVLPRSTSAPPYRQWRYFGFVVGAFATTNTLCFASSAVVFGILYNWTSDSWRWELWFSSLFWFACNLKIYEWLTQYRENYQLYRYTIGVDVDGVLNNHRDQFCKILKQETGKVIHPDQITRIPIRESNLKDEHGRPITRDDEMLVFNRLEYWRDMPLSEDAQRVLREFKETLHYDVKIFTFRPWPNPIAYRQAVEIQDWSADEKRQKLRQFRNDWDGESVLAGMEPFDPSDKWWKSGINTLLLNSRQRAMQRVTQSWFDSNRLMRNRLFVERGDMYVADPRSKLKNRFTMSRLEEIRIFIEDDAKKARKLSQVCEFVYLVSHPYNLLQDKALPKNMIRVGSLSEIMRHIRDNL